ncbi:MAG: UDP-N-acetylmuramoyl-L-alanyl-D-glutamate--2,6-diaminopimelate ligase [Thermodesulfobacteriota bacterium]|nr:UDP-N-acetylmuramoyl-L-alanyl-D-glutamate--2,6-diaminopimelate ligase [Thermodesulfobacteriota bacterium]
MRLDYLLEGIDVLESHGRTDIEIKGLTSDSREVKQDYLFVAVKGWNQDGHGYLNHAIQNGAHGLVVEKIEEIHRDTNIVRIADTRAALSKMAARFYNYPARDMKLIGITGTNGKTTTSYILESIMKDAGIHTGVIGTVNCRFNDKSFDMSLTTPESTDLMKTLREMKDAGVTHVIIEVSSHSLEQGRTRDLSWARALFTNFSRDHLDYHSTMEDYFKAKSLLFSSLRVDEGGQQIKAVINMDDPKARVLEKMTKVPVVSYGVDCNCMIRAVDIESDINGIRLKLVTPTGDVSLTSTLLGRINVYNILAAASVAYSIGVDLKNISRGVNKLALVPGRIENVKNKRELSVFVDFAHSPDALEKVLQTLRPVSSGRLIVVFGCGGDRDKGKRMDMGRVAGKNSDIVIITSDNPRGEDPEEIIDRIVPGVKESGLERIDLSLAQKEKGYDILSDRKKAIRIAINYARKGDIVLIAGKGHENYQIIGSRKKHFNDVEEAALAAV